MKVEKLNDLTYLLRFDNNIQFKELFAYLYKAYEEYCQSMECEYCNLSHWCLDYEK
jgi:hypothetical protein|nr:MAG TPA: hypothetical protein [Caudoviricetes sp.]